MVCKIQTKSAEIVNNENIFGENKENKISVPKTNMIDKSDAMKLQHLAGGNLITHPPLFAADGNHIFLLNNKTINVYSTSTGEHVRRLGGAIDKLISMQLELQQEHILVACTESGEVLRWHWESGTLNGKQNLKLSNGQILTFNLLNLYHNSENALAFVTVRYKGSPVKWQVFDTSTGYAINVAMEMRLTYKNTLVDVDATNFKFLVIAQESYLYFIDYAKWTWRRMKNPHDVPVTVVRCHPKEEAVATGDEVGKIFIWRNFMCNTTVDTSLYHWHYDSMHPPNYKLERVVNKVVLHYAENDWLSTTEDVEKLAIMLPNLVGKYLVDYPEFNHLDFVWGIDARELLYERILSLMKEHAIQ